MTLEKTKYDGLYFRLDKNGKKVLLGFIKMEKILLKL